MKIRFVALLYLLSVSLFLFAKNEQGRSYTIEGADQVTAEDKAVVRVEVLSKCKEISDGELVRHAVHGVVFRGYSSSRARTSVRPLAGSSQDEARNAGFYIDFFAAGGGAEMYGTVLRGSIGIIKSGKMYKKSGIVTVNRELLRKALERAGVINGLNSIF